MSKESEKEKEKEQEKEFHQCLWEKGSLRLIHATWAAMTISYGLNSDEITIWAEYFSLLSRSLINIAVAMGEPLFIFDDQQNGDFSDIPPNNR